MFARGETSAACRRFEQSYEEDPAPGTLYNLAICHEHEGKIDAAHRDFEDLAARAESAGHGDKAVPLHDRARALEGRLVRIDLVHRGDARSDVTGVSVDGEPLLADAWKKPLYVIPGSHSLVIKHADRTVLTRGSEATIGQPQQLVLEDADPIVPVTPTIAPEERKRSAQVIRRSMCLASYWTGGGGVAVAAV